MEEKRSEKYGTYFFFPYLISTTHTRCIHIRSFLLKINLSYIQVLICVRMYVFLCVLLSVCSVFQSTIYCSFPSASCSRYPFFICHPLEETFLSFFLSFLSPRQALWSTLFSYLFITLSLSAAPTLFLSFCLSVSVFLSVCLSAKHLATPGYERMILWTCIPSSVSSLLHTKYLSH